MILQSFLSQTSGEGSLWQAIDTFGAEWDIEASDFPAMFARAMQGAADQLDTPAVQPVAGLKLLMMRDSEVELVRECFRWLYNDEDDDLKKRRGRAEMFADQITGRFRRCFPRMNKYTMTPVQCGLLPQPVDAGGKLLLHPCRGQGLG